MKIDPGFVSHWKTQMLVARCGAEAALGLLRLWGNAQISREWSGLRLSPRKLASMMGYNGDADELWRAMTDKDAAWLDEQEDGSWELHGFVEHQKQVIKLWANGKKGGRPPKEAPPTPPEENKEHTLARPLTPFGNQVVSFQNQMVFQTPSLEDVKQAAFMMGANPERAEIWFHEMEGRGHTTDGYWIGKDGHAVRNWRSALKAWDGKWVANETAKHNGKNGHNGNPKPESVWSLQQRIEAAQKEIDRISGNPSNKEPVPGTFDRRLKAEPMAKVKALKASISEMRQRLAGVEVAA